MHLRYCLRSAFDAGITAHPQERMKAMRIKYRRATPQSMGDQWWFWRCDGMPTPLPEYLSELRLNPLDCVGFGLSQEMADDLATPADREDFAAKQNSKRVQVAEAQAAQPPATVRTFDPREVKLVVGGVQITGFTDSEIIEVRRKEQ
jgi:hypothetical protein